MFQEATRRQALLAGLGATAAATTGFAYATPAAATRSVPGQAALNEAAHPKTAILRDFSFSDGSKMDLRLGYYTLGTRASDDSNVVLMLHATNDSAKRFLQPEIADVVFGPGAPLDLSRYFIVIPDAIGHGSSSRPSDGMGAEFPRYGYHDMVAAQYALVRDVLGIEHLRLLLGTSMGGMHAWLWGQLYPHVMSALMPIGSLPAKIDGRNLFFRRLLIDIIKSDPGYAGAQVDTRLPSVGTAKLVINLMLGDPAVMEEAYLHADQTDLLIQKAIAEQGLLDSPHDLIWQIDSSRDYDPGPGLGLIRAPLLAVNFAGDSLNPEEFGELSRGIAMVPRARGVTLSADHQSHGHWAFRDARTWREHLVELLRVTE